MPHLTLLGSLELREGDTVLAQDKKPLLVLAALALSADRLLHRDDVGRLLWPGRPEANERHDIVAGNRSQGVFLLAGQCSLRAICSE